MNNTDNNSDRIYHPIENDISPPKNNIDDINEDQPGKLSYWPDSALIIINNP